MKTPLILSGDAALSDFRLSALLKNVQAALPMLGVSEIDAVHVYFVETEDGEADGCDEDTLRKTYALLEARGPFEREDGFLVTPRIGTISPWSSKATDIFRNCGLQSIHRVERGIHYRVITEEGHALRTEEMETALELLYDRMTEGVYTDASGIFERLQPAPCVVVDVLSRGKEALAEANVGMGLALSDDEMDYLCDAYRRIQRNPTDVELVMFGQVNSEHCRHKIFNADWVIDGLPCDRSLFSMIRHTHEQHPEGTLVAYKDNSGVIEGFEEVWYEVDPAGSGRYRFARGRLDVILKVETHNHPTAISPYPGAATGVGGEIRDEGATGTGARSKAGLSGFMVSNLRVPGFEMPWEKPFAEFPDRLATPLEIMIEGPLGGARFGNEFGRPQLFGFFRTYEECVEGRYRGYHKPIMIAGGMGNIKRAHVEKRDIPPAALIIQIGGPAMRIGLGGGAASSMATGSNAAELDFDSVQRDNAEMQRRCQEVINACVAMDEDNPILSIHDIGAGGLSNGCPELIAETGGKFFLRKIHNEDLSMSPMEIWCCEAQERYVLAVLPDCLETFLNLCERERCEVAVIGEATGDEHLSLEDTHFGDLPIDIDLSVILGKPPKMLRAVRRVSSNPEPVDVSEIALHDAVDRVLHLPCVANKTFLITIADRSVTGLVCRDQMTGPYQTPIADVAVTATSYPSYHGEAMSMGERTPLALISAPAAGRMAVGEALTNMAAADIGEIGKIKFSGNWMCACGEDGEDANLYDTVRAVAMDLCPQLGVAIPVGKDSLSMRTLWDTSDGAHHRMTAPLSLIISAFAPVRDVRRTVTPELKPVPSVLMLLDLGQGANRLGGSALAQTVNRVGRECPDLDDPARMRCFFEAVQNLVGEGLLLAYHDRSDGGLFVTLAEMAFGAGSGIEVTLDGLGSDPLTILFAEELGAVLQVAEEHVARVEDILGRHGLTDILQRIGHPTGGQTVDLLFEGEQVFSESVRVLKRTWSDLTAHMQAARDNPECAREEYDALPDAADPGMTFQLTFDPSETVRISEARPRMAVLREQGINGHVEMAAAFDLAGFESVDVHMTDLMNGRTALDEFAGLVACGGFSYGDVLGAGSGWANSILFNERLKEMFARFFARPETFSLGVCNGCQMISQLKAIIPGAAHWPHFSRNRSEQFEARYVTAEILPSPSVFFKGMEASRLGIPVAHGEGRADFENTGSLDALRDGELVCVRYVDNYGHPAETYPFNPNGSAGGITGFTTEDGRVTIMMPHPERAFRSVQMSYRPAGMFEGEEGPWLRMFRNARAFVD